MTTLPILNLPASSTHHRCYLYAAAATGLAGTLVAITLNTAYAMPGRDDHPTAPASTVHTHGHYVGHGCFITPHTWNDALAGPMPICYTYVP